MPSTRNAYVCEPVGYVGDRTLNGQLNAPAARVHFTKQWMMLLYCCSCRYSALVHHVPQSVLLMTFSIVHHYH